ncbi:ATP-binding protein [Streptomyces coeruleorubidus]|uniref:ATP-binding protein n=1 Tax=Streptomyces coeruleorubidus TaxID=116188 RepID=UPI0033DDDEB4
MGEWELEGLVSVSRPVLVGRLLELDAAGGLTSAHVRAGARLAGVHSRTVWRWVEAARSEGRVERRRRSRFELSDQAWEVLAQAGGNVSVLYRHLKDCGDGDAGVSLASVYRAVQRELAAGRVLPDRAVVRQERVERETRQALADLVVAGAGVGAPSAGGGAGPAELMPSREAAPVAQASGVVLPAGAQAVHTASVRAVAEAVGQAMAAEGAACVFGDAGRGKTAALRMALSDPPVGWSVTWVRVPVRPSVSELRRAVFEALTLPGRFPHRSAEADERIIGALGQARVLVVDEAQRLPVPCLEYLQSLWDHPQARMALVLCGAGSERAVARVPQLASRICAWQEVGRLAAGEVAATVSAFHPLWAGVADGEVAWIDQSCTHGVFRTWAALTTHLQNALLTVPDATVDRALLRRLFRRLSPPA